MRLTVHLQDKLAEEIRTRTANEALSVSYFVVKSLEPYIIKARERRNMQKTSKHSGQRPRL